MERFKTLPIPAVSYKKRLRGKNQKHWQFQLYPVRQYYVVNMESITGLIYAIQNWIAIPMTTVSYLKRIHGNILKHCKVHLYPQIKIKWGGGLIVLSITDVSQKKPYLWLKSGALQISVVSRKAKLPGKSQKHCQVHVQSISQD